MNIWTNHNFKDYCNVKNMEINDLPDGVNISTMTASIKGTNLTYNISNIFKYLELNKNDIISVNKNKTEKRTLLIETKKSRKKNEDKKGKKRRLFFNQVSVVVRVFEGDCEDLSKEKKVNFKLFVNGSIQMSGVKKIEYANRAINKLMHVLSKPKAKINKKKKIEKINFVENLENINTEKFKIDMINSNYRIRIMIDRSKLYQLLLKKKIKSSFEKAIRACVIIKFKPLQGNEDEKEISIFIFQKGNIIITGARRRSHILEAFEYVNSIILTHVDEIVIPDEDEKKQNIIKYYKEVINENSHKLETIYGDGKIPDFPFELN